MKFDKVEKSKAMVGASVHIQAAPFQRFVFASVRWREKNGDET